MKKISIVILLAIAILLVAADPPPPPRWFFVLFQLGYNDTTVWGYHLWIIDIGDSAFPSLTDGDSLCVYITKGSIWGRKCIAYDDLALYQIMRIVLPDTSSLIIEDDKYKRKPRLRYLKGRFDLRGRRLQGTPPTVYIEDGKVKIRLK